MSNKTILLVEDNQDDEILTTHALKKSNIMNEIVVVRDGAEALDYIFSKGKFTGKNNLQNIQLILLDLKLPKIDGLEVLKKIKEHNQAKLIPVVILTSSKLEEDMVKGYSLGANSYIRKPVDFEHFSDTIIQLGMYWLVLNESPLDSGSNE